VTNAVQGPRRLRAIDGVPLAQRGADGVFALMLARYEADRRAGASLASR
jgi:hypothetical protein